MKFLVASTGNRLESCVAKRFEHAAWYLIADSETHTVEAVRHITPQDRHRVFLNAAFEGTAIVVAGKFGHSSLKLIRTHTMRIARVHGISAQAAIEKIVSREIEPEEVREMSDVRRIFTGMAERTIPRARESKCLFPAAGYSSDSPRGHHHLQQYGGRGH